MRRQKPWLHHRHKSYAARYLYAMGLPAARAWIAGALHDSGKYSPDMPLAYSKKRDEADRAYGKAYADFNAGTRSPIRAIWNIG